MLSRLCKLSILSICIVFGAGTSNTQQQILKYYCPVSQAYKDYQAGTLKIEQVPSFDSQASCDTSCSSSRTCEYSPSVISTTSIANIIQGQPVNIDDINKKIASLGNIMGIQIKANNSLQLQLSSLMPFAVTELFKPIKDSDLEKNGFKATMNGGTTQVSDLTTGNIFFEVTPTTAMMQKTTGEMRVAHSMCQKEEKIPEAEYNKLYAQYEQLLKEYNDKKTNVAPTIPSKTRVVDYQCTKITEGGITKEKNGWINLAQAIGVTITSSSVIFNVQEANSDGSPSSKFQTYTINVANGVGEYILAVEGHTGNEIQADGKSLFFEISAHDPTNTKNFLFSVNEGADGIRVDGSFEIVVLTENTSAGYRCPFNSSIVGDLGLNSFSSSATCEASCMVSSSCVTVDGSTATNNGQCKIISSEFINTVTDVNNKTFHLARKITRECNIETQKETGCAQYETKTTNSPNIKDLLKGGIPVVQTNKQNHDFSKAMEVFGVSAMAENIPHIFSAEASYCDKGQFIDKFDVWNLLDYAFMIAGPAFETIKNTGTAGQAAASVATGATSSGVSAAISAAKSNFASFMSNTLKIVSKETAEKIFTNLTVAITKEITESAWKSICSNNSNGTLCPEQEQNEKMSQVFVTGNQTVSNSNDLNGAISANDLKAVEYATCMTERFSLTYQDVMNYTSGLAVSNVLHYSTEYPVLVTATELYSLREVMSNPNATVADDINKYFYARYNIDNNQAPCPGDSSKTCYGLTALKGEDYMIAAETICRGQENLSYIRNTYGERFLNPDLATPTLDKEYPASNELQTKEESLPGFSEDSDVAMADTGFTGSDAANMAMDIAIGSVPFPGNLALSVLKDALEMFEDKGNTCTDMELAEKRAQKEGDNTYITTNKRISLGLCTKVATEERNKIAGTVIRKREHYCCFDQVSTKIMAEGSMVQLGKKMTKENCAPITVDDLTKVSFRACQANEDPAKNNCFPTQKFKELTDVFVSGSSIGVQDAVEGIIEGMFNLNQAQ